MKNIWAICKKELQTYFTSPLAYVIITVFLVLTGFFFSSILSWFNSQAIQLSRYPEYYQQLNINQMVYVQLFHNISIFLLLTIPLITMRLLSEEKKMKTDELLFTSPISINQIILGKYLASLIVLLVMLIFSAVPTLFSYLYGNPETAPLLCGYLGLFLMGASFMAVGFFFSSLTEHQAGAAIMTGGTLLIFWVLNWVSGSAGGILKPVLDYISFFGHFDDMTRGILDTTDLTYYLSFIFLGLFLTHSVIQTRRWR